MGLKLLFRLFNPFPLKAPKSARMLKMSSAKYFAYFFFILSKFCLKFVWQTMQNHIPRSTASLGVFWLLAPRTRQGRLLTHSDRNQKRVKTGKMTQLLSEQK